jgi:microsomal dipeptidase-like Zn-dependent dipeptidase
MNNKADAAAPILIDCLQYCRWSRPIFEDMRAGGVSAVHATIAYHETFRETVERLTEWNQRFQLLANLILPGRTANDIHRASATGRTAIFLGLQSPSPIEGDIALLEILHTLGIRFMQLSYNNQSLLCSGWQEVEDTGITRMGREVIAEMNRLGMVIDMSHSGERSTLQAIESSQRPIAITHANPSSWRDTNRNKSDHVLRALAQSGGMVGLSAYPHHLRGGSACTLENYCEMVAGLAEQIGAEHIGIGSDLCQDQPNSVVLWMRTGRWTFGGETISQNAVFPPQPEWYRSNRDLGRLRFGLENSGFSAEKITGILGANWLRFMTKSFAPADGSAMQI